MVQKQLQLFIYLLRMIREIGGGLVLQQLFIVAGGCASTFG